MNYRAVSITGGVLCGLALLGLNYGPGGFNPWSNACAALMVAGFVVGLVFHILASREDHGKMAAEAGLRHVGDLTFDIAFAGEPQGIPMRLDFQPPGKNTPYTACRVRMALGLPSQLQADVSGEGLLTRDVGGLLQALPKITSVPSWLEGFGVYGRPEEMVREALARVGGLQELEETGWTLVRLGISDGNLHIKATSKGFILGAHGLRTIQDACARIALRATGRA